MLIERTDGQTDINLSQYLSWAKAYSEATQPHRLYDSLNYIAIHHSMALVAFPTFEHRNMETAVLFPLA